MKKKVYSMDKSFKPVSSIYAWLLILFNLVSSKELIDDRTMYARMKAAGTKKFWESPSKVLVKNNNNYYVHDKFVPYISDTGRRITSKDQEIMETTHKAWEVIEIGFKYYKKAQKSKLIKVEAGNTLLVVSGREIDTSFITAAYYYLFWNKSKRNGLVIPTTLHARWRLLEDVETGKAKFSVASRQVEQQAFCHSINQFIRESGPFHTYDTEFDKYVKELISKLKQLDI